MLQNYPPDDLYFPLLPERAPSEKMLFHLRPMVGTWTSFEVPLAVQNGYVIDEIFKQYHFPQHSNTLFKAFNDTFFKMKRKAKAEGNKGLESIANLLINGPAGKCLFNIAKQKGNPHSQRNGRIHATSLWQLDRSIFEFIER